MSLVAHYKIKGNTKQAVLDTVKKAMRAAQWKKFVHGKKIFLKINLLSHQVVPGHCTSPWVLEAVIQELQSLNAKIFVGDADVATVHQVKRAAHAWGIRQLCKQYNATFVNLSNYTTVKKNVHGAVFNHVYLPKPLADADAIISIPVLKTHALCTMTCALKNQWGCIPRFRHIYHDRIHHAIAEINTGVPVSFVIVDATVCSEGKGPRNGTPKIVNSILTSPDRVAIDTAAARLMGIDPSRIRYLHHAEELNLGTTRYTLKGDPLTPTQFQLADINKMIIVKWEMRLRHTPILRTILFKTPLFSLFAWFATQYNSQWWYRTVGKKIARKFIKQNTVYAQEFAPLIK